MKKGKDCLQLFKNSELLSLNDCLEMSPALQPLLQQLGTTPKSEEFLGRK